MTLQQLKYLIKVSECENFSEAAKELFISQPSLSVSIKELEKEFGVTLFIRSKVGAVLTDEGLEFLAYARQVVEQADMIEAHFNTKQAPRKISSISTQHYAFAIDAFVKTIKRMKLNSYDFVIRETRTFDIIENVKNFKSEIGILYLSGSNRKVITSLLKESHLKFNSIAVVKPHIFISEDNPLADKDIVSMKDLEDFPCLTFEQGKNNSFHFSEEILNNVPHKKNIKVTDRATLFNLLIGLNGYTVCSGIINNDLNNTKIISKQLKTDELIDIGWIKHDKIKLSDFALAFIDELNNVCKDTYDK